MGVTGVKGFGVAGQILRGMLVLVSALAVMFLHAADAPAAAPDAPPDPGAAFVFGAESPVDPAGGSQEHPAVSRVDGRIYAFYTDSRPVPGLMNFTGIYFQDITDLPARDGQAPPPGRMLTPVPPSPAATGARASRRPTATWSSGGR
ncbi:MAG: hypothetical protein ACYCXF_05135 [Thermoleophilia bacterium]